MGFIDRQYRIYNITLIDSREKYHEFNIFEMSANSN